MKLKNKDEEKYKGKISIEKKSFYSDRETDMMYRIVRDYLYDHQGENAIQVSEATGVPKEVIMRFLSQGKISLAPNTKHFLHECKVCGGLIETGDICTDCLRSKMSEILNPEQPKKKKNISGFSVPNAKQNSNYGRRIRNK